MITVMDKITLKAYAKVNLTLDVVGRRADGYHLLKSVMQSISLSDTITLQKKAQQGISIESDNPLVPNDECGHLLDKGHPCGCWLRRRKCRCCSRSLWIE